ncbi:Crp/Fnr family transcriptional regulator [Flavobacterium sp. Fl-77]|uniref:Crp/Fnr family transcriptional regulator n=1 Tax=Flavobacterium flavipigmentatum TaxID=2893884 RepID=A0AAJ2S836_9FLAO|nr:MULTISPECIES: Crp/Fnr family transcriptional regulator [unclassified Flavobacterium]MDX6182880.1 Crp/Fnr family transcriptional regulator [Flavobacterium sp. Fl-33]MDX6186333.1 Crp/Fnr family transcriptional regulator [Flavobacterium sp. Fl-77]UFH37878.1 Crp/Fnr family transcriptional regulator [Flavobacterium sp. F-70]
MDHDLEKIRELISSFIEISDSEWAQYSPKFTVEKFSKKEVILCQNTICKNIYFIINGLIRSYYVDDNDEERIFHFAVENTFATNYESFIKGIPSSFSMQASENTTVLVITIEMVQELYKNLKNGEKLGRLIAENYFFMLNDRIKALYTQTPLQRYNSMNATFPRILERVPQHYIASYLNITSVHLSRLKYGNKED